MKECTDLFNMKGMKYTKITNHQEKRQTTVMTIEIDNLNILIRGKVKVTDRERNLVVTLVMMIKKMTNMGNRACLI
jgi:hypothetical protein